MELKALRVLVIIFAVAILSGCGKIPEPTQTTDATGATAISGDTVKIPADFPLPAYPNSKTTVSADTPVGDIRIRSVMMTCQDDAEKICSFYSSWLMRNGWTVKNPNASVGMGSFTSAERGTDQATVTALRTKDQPETTITINIQSAKK